MFMTGLVFLICLAEVLTMVGIFAVPALLNDFIEVWYLSNTEAGWITGVLLGAYAISVPIIVNLTDRIDARTIYIFGALTASLSFLLFAIFAQGFWSAFVFRIISGIGLAATYMPGLRMLVDRYQGDRASRGVAFYTASFSLGTAVSFLYLEKSPLYLVGKRHF